MCSEGVAPYAPSELTGRRVLVYCGRKMFTSAGRTLLLRVQLVKSEFRRLSLSNGPPCLLSGGSLSTGGPT